MIEKLNHFNYAPLDGDTILAKSNKVDDLTEAVNTLIRLHPKHFGELKELRKALGDND